jgi:hypothetical protein
MLPFLSKNNLFFYFFIERDTLNGRECHVRDTECLAPGSFCAKVLHPSALVWQKAEGWKARLVGSQNVPV